jgi:hypothetical protein
MLKNSLKKNFSKLPFPARARELGNGGPGGALGKLASSGTYSLHTFPFIRNRQHSRF